MKFHKLKYRKASHVSLCSIQIDIFSYNMPRLTESERNQAIGMLSKSGVSEVAAFFNTSLRTIKLLRARWHQTGSVKDRPRLGRPRVTTVAEDRRIRTLHLRNRFQTASHTARTFPVNISRHTVHRRLKSFRIMC